MVVAVAVGWRRGQERGWTRRRRKAREEGRTETGEAREGNGGKRE